MFTSACAAKSMKKKFLSMHKAPMRASARKKSPSLQRAPKRAIL